MQFRISLRAQQRSVLQPGCYRRSSVQRRYPCARRSDLAEGVQADASWRINDSYTLRGGFLGQVETTAFDTNSFVLPIDATWAQTSNVPFGIVDNGARTGGLYGVYLQDEWRLLPDSASTRTMKDAGERLTLGEVA